MTACVLQVLEEIRIVNVSQQAGISVEDPSTDRTGGSSGRAGHVAFVLDRHCDQTGMEVGEVDRMRSIIEMAARAGLSNLTLIEESGGPTNQTLYFKYLLQHIDRKEEKIIFKVLDKQEKLQQTEASLTVTMIPAYSGRSDVVAAVKQTIKRLSKRDGEYLTGRPETSEREPGWLEAEIGKQTRAGTLPEPDLMVFFGGRRNLGEVGVWMGAYSEFAFLDKSWHSFNADDLADLLADFGLRERRFGAV